MPPEYAERRFSMKSGTEWSRDEIRAMDNDSLLLGLIFAYHKDFDAEDRRTWSDETVELWQEALDRMREPVIQGLDKAAYLAKLKEEYDKQGEILKGVDHTYSYHYGIKSGINIAIREFRAAITEGQHE